MNAEASRSHRHPALYWFGAILLWLGLAFSLGWYYTFTYYGHAGWPMPLVDACAAIIIYYFSVLNVDTEIQAAHWMLVFPLAGAIWTTAIWLLAPRFGQTRPPLARWCFLMALSALPIVLASPPTAFLAGETSEGFRAQRMIDVALRHGVVAPAGWLTPLYFSLGVAGLLMQLFAYRRTFPGPVYRALLHLLIASVATVLASCVAGAALGLPLRIWLE